MRLGTAPYGSGVALLPDRCPTCGIQAATIKPGDAAAAVRSYPRRYRLLLVRPDDDEGAGVVTRRPSPGEWSAMEHGAHVADVTAAVADAVERIQRHDEPEITVETAPPQPRSVDEVLDRLAGASERLASAIDGIKGRDWQRAGLLPTGERVTALELVRHAVHTGAHHRREIERVMAAVR